MTPAPRVRSVPPVADPPASTGRSRAAFTVLASVILIGLGALVYANSLDGPFFFDDRASIVDNPKLQQLWPPSAPSQSPISGRPVVILSLALNHAVGGLDGRGYHVFNVAIHILCALALFGAVRRTLLRGSFDRDLRAAADGLALAAASIWLVHPLPSECVNYITQRTESLMALFYLVTVYATVRSRGVDRWLVVAVTSCALGMASKESMVTAPVMVVILDRIYLSMPWRDRRLLYAGLASTWVVLAALIRSGPRSDTVGAIDDITALDYAWSQCKVVVGYLGKVMWPHPLAVDYGQPEPTSFIEVAPWALVLGAALCVTAIALVLRPRVGFLMAWFFAILAPTSSIVPITSEVGAERRVYLALAGLVVLLVVAGHRLLRSVAARAGGEPSRRAPIVVTVLLSVLLGATTIARNRDYRSHVAIWTSAVEATPRNPRAQNNLGVALELAGRADDAVAHYRSAVELMPDYANARYNLANVLAARGELQEAVELYVAALRSDPDSVRIHVNLGVAYRRLGRVIDAIRSLSRAVEIDPDVVEAHENLAGAFRTLGDRERMARHARRALELDPSSPARELLSESP